MPSKKTRFLKLTRRDILLLSGLWILIQIIFFIFILTATLDIAYETFPFNIIYKPFTPKALSTDEIIELYKSIMPLHVGSTLFAAIAGSLIVSKGRTIEEGLAIFIGYAIPRRRKLSGRVFDVQTEGNLPFIDVRIIDEKDNSVVASAITDFDGRYRINLPRENDNFIVQVKVKGYEFYKKLLINVYKNNVIQDIPLENNDTVRGGIKTFYYYYLKPKLYVYFTYFLYFLSIFALGSMFLLVPDIGLSLYVLTFFLIYGTSVVWNTSTLFTRFRFKSGKVVDFDSKKPISGAGVSLYSDDNQLQAHYTNKRGIVRINLPDGVYRVVVTKLGYKMVDEQGAIEQAEDLFIHKDGYLPKNILLKKVDAKNITEGESLDSPFN